jgi:hypothetical protein
VRTCRTHSSLGAFAVAVPVTLLALCSPPPAGAGEPALAAPAAAKLKAAVSDLRNAGTAMFAWYKTELEPKRHKAAKPYVPALEDVTKVPLISYAGLEKILVPRYIKVLPQDDPWGHPYEYRLSQDPEADEVMVVRSAGNKATFSANVYKVGAFPPGAASHDLVWKDGYFVNWPDPGVE